jgi:hypothetical protein
MAKRSYGGLDWLKFVAACWSLPIIPVMMYRRMSMKAMLAAAGFLYVVGLLGDSYYFRMYVNNETTRNRALYLHARFLRIVLRSYSSSLSHTTSVN